MWPVKDTGTYVKDTGTECLERSSARKKYKEIIISDPSHFIRLL
jgi:hypothetical protein